MENTKEEPDKKITKSNDEIRAFFEKNGMDVPSDEAIERAHAFASSMMDRNDIGVKDHIQEMVDKKIDSIKRDLENRARQEIEKLSAKELVPLVGDAINKLRYLVDVAQAKGMGSAITIGLMLDIVTDITLDADSLTEEIALINIMGKFLTHFGIEINFPDSTEGFCSCERCKARLEAIKNIGKE